MTSKSEEILRRNCTVFVKGKLRDVVETKINLPLDTEVVFALIEVRKK